MGRARSVWRQYGDQLLAVSLAVLWNVEVWFSGEVDQHRPAAAAVAVVMAAALSVRRSVPLLPLLAAIAVIQLNHTVLPGLAEGGSFMVVVIVSIFSAGCYARGPALVLAALTTAGLVPLAAFDPRQPPTFGDLTFFTVFLCAPFVLGLFLRRRRVRDERLAVEAERARRDGELRARKAVAEERVRIARELHDVVAHAISVIVLQSRGGRRALETGTDEPRAAFDAIEHAGEQALSEMRRLLAMLREDDAAGLEPQPGLDHVDELAARLRAAGLPVEVLREGEPVELTPGLDLSAYRIVQEALTNALKHAGPARVRVVLHYLPDELEVEVLDDGAGSGAGGGTGRGLAGIHERVGVYGGRLDAGRLPAGGYAVRARLPLGAAR